MERSIAQGPLTDARDDRLAASLSGTGPTVVIGLAIAALLLGIYLVSNLERSSYYNHFVWQAEAFLDGHAQIRYPVADSPAGRGNELFQDVIVTTGPNGEPSGYALLAFPPLPAVVLMPFVALWGLATDDQLIATCIGALDVAIAFWLLGRLPIRRTVRIATTIFIGLGTVLWYAAELGSTWFLAHVIAIGLTSMAIGVALSADPGAAIVAREEHPPDGSGRPKRNRFRLDGSQVLAGLLFGLACTARLTVVFGAPFFLLVGGGGGFLRRGVSAAIGMALPLGALATYNLVTTGQPFNAGYDVLYWTETIGYPGLNYHREWSIEDPRYLIQNLPLLVAGLPSILPACDPGVARALFDPACPLVAPKPIGMSLFLTSPGWLLAFPALRWYGRIRVVTAAAAAVTTIAVADLMHFSQGWVQFGYRFSNDFAPFALLLVALTLESAGRYRRIGYGLIVASIVVNAWGVAWGHLLGW